MSTQPGNKSAGGSGGDAGVRRCIPFRAPSLFTAHISPFHLQLLLSTSLPSGNKSRQLPCASSPLAMPEKHTEPKLLETGLNSQI